MQAELFDLPETQSDGNAGLLENPKAYRGLYGFHKYWGKKPCEPLAFAVERLTDAGDTVLDPFVGSGTAARESLLRGRKFIGFDVNPAAVELSRLLASPPDCHRIHDAFLHVKSEAKKAIEKTYVLRDGSVASHYLWNGGTLQQIWSRGSRGSSRMKMQPTAHDLKLAERFEGYASRCLRSPEFFSNSRINTNRNLKLADLLTGRAQHNLDCLLKGIDGLPSDVISPIKLCLTAASGQMSKMVFAITKRGKTAGNAADGIEVGSWAIGYWRPRLHFEVNVWNCFERRVRKLLKALKSKDPLNGLRVSSSLNEYYKSMHSRCCIERRSCQNGTRSIEPHSVKLILTDPPHGDRMPYLELSELWNAILDTKSRFEDEIVISNARERGKSPQNYQIEMDSFFSGCGRILRKDGFLVLFYNARQASRWEFVDRMIAGSDRGSLQYLGCFPCRYSARSVVQDNRRGGLKTDAVLVFSNSDADLKARSSLFRVPGWSDQGPNG